MAIYDQIQAARNPDEIVAIASRYVSLLPEEALAVFPEDCRPRPVRDPDDVLSLARSTLQRREALERERKAVHSVFDMGTDVFQMAARRLAELRRASGPRRDTH